MIVFYIFTFVGSTLGILAFVLQILTPISVHNKAKGARLTTVLSITDLKNYASEVSQGRVHKHLYDKIEALTAEIRKDTDLIRFKQVLGNKPKQQLNELVKEYNELKKKMQAPLWDAPANPFLINKYLLVVDEETINKKELEKLDKKIKKMINLYQSVLLDLDKLPYQYLRFW